MYLETEEPAGARSTCDDNICLRHRGSVLRQWAVMVSSSGQSAFVELQVSMWVLLCKRTVPPGRMIRLIDLGNSRSPSISISERLLHGIAVLVLNELSGVDLRLVGCGGDPGDPLFLAEYSPQLLHSTSAETVHTPDHPSILVFCIHLALKPQSTDHRPPSRKREVNHGQLNCNC